MNETILEKSALPISESEVISKVLSGETGLFEILIRRNNPHLYKMGRSYGYNHHDTEDLMQETYLDAYAHLAGFRQQASFKTWILKIMINKCHYKRSKSSYKNELPSDIMLHEKSTPMFTGNHAETERVLMNNELKVVIEKALEKIPFDYRMVFSLREINGLNVADTAEILSITENNVKVRLNRARHMLRGEVQKMYLPEDLYEFNLIYCDSLTRRVLAAIEKQFGDLHAGQAKPVS